jgi:hypothetical protein
MSGTSPLVGLLESSPKGGAYLVALSARLLDVYEQAAA